MLFRVCIFLIAASLSGFLIGKPIDGRWNGKEWEFEELKKGVEKEEADALAEWAYCMRENWFDLHGSPQEIFNFARRASEKGSLLGDALLSRMYTKGLGVEKDEEKGIAYARKAHEGGHPLGTKNFANLYFLELGDFKRDAKRIHDLAQKAADGGCVMAKYNLALYQVNGDVFEKKNYREGIRKMADLVVRYDSDLAALFLFEHHYYLQKGIGDLLPERVLEKAHAILRRKATAGKDSASLCLLGCYHLSKGEKEKGIPLLLQSYKSPNPSWISRKVLFYLARGYRIGQREKIFGAEAYTLQEIGLSGIDLGFNDENMYFHGGLSHFHHLNGKPKDFPKGVEYLLKSHKLGEEEALTEIGKMLIYRRTPAEFQNLPLGVAVLTYHSKDDVLSWIKLADTLRDRGFPLYDPVKAYALNSNLIGHNHITEAAAARFTRQAAELRKILTEAQLAEADALIRDKYPLGEKVREEAFKVMKAHPYFKDLN